jgi:biopolymer transport protein ExbD
MNFAAPSPSRLRLDLTPILGLGLLSILLLLLAMEFSRTSQEVAQRLPATNLARPPAPPASLPVSVQLTDRKTVILGGEEVALDDAPRLLEREYGALEVFSRDPGQAVLIVRADRGSPTGRVQELVEMGQRAGFQRFLFRPRQQGREGAPP